MPNLADEIVNFHALPADVLFQICQDLSVADILALRQTCRTLHDLTQERSIWHDVLHTELLSRGLPVPGLLGRPLASLAALELEHVTTKAISLCRTSRSAKPRHTQQFDLAPEDLPPDSRARNISVRFLPGRGNQWLLVTTLYNEHVALKNYLIHCWDVTANPPKCIALLRSMSIAGLRVNTDPDHPAILALSCRESEDMVTTSIYSINFAANDKYSAFILLHEFPSSRKPVSLHGSTFVATDSDNVVRLVDIDTQRIKYDLHVPSDPDNATLYPGEQRCIDSLMFGNYILTFCRQWIYVYFLQSEAPPDALKPEHLEPVSSHKWQYKIDTLVVQPRAHAPPYVESRAPALPLIDIVIRFDTPFHWPSNIIHHYALYPARDYPTKDRTPSHDGLCVPYLCKCGGIPFMLRSIPSPVRLFTSHDIVLGRTGTALWLDAQTADSGPVEAGIRGQRIAGSCVAHNSQKGMPGTTSPEGRPRVNDWYGPGIIAETWGGGRTGGANMRFSSRITEFVMHGNEDKWITLAVDDEEGRIAIGTLTGQVSLYEYTPRIE